MPGKGFARKGQQPRAISTLLTRVYDGEHGGLGPSAPLRPRNQTQRIAQFLKEAARASVADVICHGLPYERSSVLVTERFRPRRALVVAVRHVLSSSPSGSTPLSSQEAMPQERGEA